MVAAGVNAGGRREVLGCEPATTEDGTGGTSFLRRLVARGRSGAQLAISDAHAGLTEAAGAVLPGAVRQRCRTHYRRNLLTKAPKSAQPLVATPVRSIFARPATEEVLAQHRRVVEQLAERVRAAADHLDAAGPEILACRGFPKDRWRQIWSTNPRGRLHKEIRRRIDAVGTFPNRDSVVRLIGAVLAEQHDEWADTRRHRRVDALLRSEPIPITTQELPRDQTSETNDEDDGGPPRWLIHHHDGRDRLLIHEGKSLADVAASVGNSVISDHYLRVLKVAELGDRTRIAESFYAARGDGGVRHLVGGGVVVPSRRPAGRLKSSSFTGDT